VKGRRRGRDQDGNLRLEIGDWRDENRGGLRGLPAMNSVIKWKSWLDALAQPGLQFIPSPGLRPTLSTPEEHLIRPSATFSPSNAEKGNLMGEGQEGGWTLSLTQTLSTCFPSPRPSPSGGRGS
jgi:hypothetical protein